MTKSSFKLSHLHKHNVRARKNKQLQRAILTALYISSITIITWMVCYACTRPMVYYQAYDNGYVQCIEYTERAKYIGDNTYITDDGNVWEYCDNTKRTADKSYTLIFNNRTDADVSNAVVVGVQ